MRIAGTKPFDYTSTIAFVAWMAFVLVFMLLAFWMDNILPALVPLITPLVVWVINDYRNLYYLFFALVPFSIEYNFTPSLGTDLPSEPIMMLLFGISLLLFCAKAFHSNLSRYINPISGLLLVHLMWIFITTLNSEYFVLSGKIFLAKLWYIIPFYFMSIHILKQKSDLVRMLKFGIFMLAISISIVLVRQSMNGFAFDEVNDAVMPIFRNHVNYACIIVIFLPYLWAMFIWAKSSNDKWLYGFLMVLYAAGVYFSYTRAAILSMVLSIVIYYIIKKRFMVPALAATMMIAAVGVSFLLYNNNYLRYNPVFERTITHQRFDKLITATYNMEDISTMERVYRWVAGIQMVKDKPMMGFGPGTFYSTYEAYTVTSFQTYVSDNPEKSTVHNYFLLIFIEQGMVGFLIFISLCIAVLVLGERTYHKLTKAEDKVAVMAAMLSFCIILLLNTINDMIETDKVGPFFFLSMAIISIYYFKANQTLGKE
ncbi:MAG TPA: O-antigen ligase family protein [Saprospiraceae bacterium]|nr:O-antigen ligase family protein [Saprospiraceae bacterium]